LGQPNSSVAAAKVEAVAMHAPGGHPQDHGRAASAADLDGGVGIAAEVHVVTLASIEAALEDRRDEARWRAVIELRRRLDRLEPEIDRDRVALRGSDPAAVGADRESGLAVGGHAALELLARARPAELVQRFEQPINLDPARAVELEADRVRLVSQDPREQLAQLVSQLIVPRSSSESSASRCSMR